MMTPSFGELLAKYMNRAGISDSELARTIGVQRQTIFRWKEGIVARPRVREDVLRCASKLRLSREERDQLLLAAGFPPETIPTPAAEAEPLAAESTADAPNPQPTLAATVVPTLGNTLPTLLETPTVVSPMATQATKARRRSWPTGAGALVGLALVLVGWLWWSGRLALPEATPVAPVSKTPVLVQPLLSSTALPGKGIMVTAPLTTTSAVTATNVVSALWPRANSAAMLIVVAPFADQGSQPSTAVAERIRAELQKAILDSNLITMTVQIGPRAIQDEVDAQQVLTTTQATIVIWGDYDKKGARVHWLTPKASKAENQDFSFTSPADQLVTINENVPKEMQIVALYTLGRVFQENKAYEKAERAYQHALALQPQNDRLAAWINFYLGLLISRDRNGAQSIKNFNEGIRYYTTAYDLYPALYSALYNRGTAWLNRSLALTETAMITASLTQAIDDFTRLFEQPDLRALYQQKPEFANAYFNRGTAYYYRHQPGDQVNAMADLTEVIALDPGYYAAWYQRAVAGIRAGDDLTWTSDLTRTLELQPNYHRVYDAFCWGYVLAQQPHTALPYCTTALLPKHLEPKEYDSHDALGIVYAQLGRYEEAIAALETYRLWIEVYHPQRYSALRGPTVESWIVILKTNQNPFDVQTLASLR